MQPPGGWRNRQNQIIVEHTVGGLFGLSAILQLPNATFSLAREISLHAQRFQNPLFLEWAIEFVCQGWRSIREITGPATVAQSLHRPREKPKQKPNRHFY
jgi:hypothetical protein